MTNLYIVRHVQSKWNIERRFQGSKDIEVSEFGKLQGDLLATFFNDIHIDICYSSPLKRTEYTANSICYGKDIDIIFDNRIVELNGGIWEGQLLDELSEKYPKEFDIWHNSPWDFYVEDSEKMSDVFKRTNNFLKDILTIHKDKTVVIVSHGWALKNIICNALNLDIHSINEFNLAENAGVTNITINEFGRNLLYFSRTDFLDSINSKAEIINENNVC